MAQHGEASVEEILESIKKVIARDNRAGAIEARRRRAEESQPEPVDEEEAEEVLELGADEILEIEDELDEGEADDSDPALVTEQVRASMQENFAALAMLAEPGKQPQIVRTGETSLEGLVRDMLRPMLAEWLDTNLPGMVEDMVQAEIARIAGKRS